MTTPAPAATFTDPAPAERLERAAAALTAINFAVEILEDAADGPVPSTACPSSTRNPNPGAPPSCCSAKPSDFDPPQRRAVGDRLGDRLGRGRQAHQHPQHLREGAAHARPDRHDRVGRTRQQHREVTPVSCPVRLAHRAVRPGTCSREVRRGHAGVGQRIRRTRRLI